MDSVELKEIEEVYCKNCSQGLLDSDFKFDIDGDVFCADCVCECEDCDSIIPLDQSCYVEDNRTVCDDCAHNYIDCDYCGRNVHEENLVANYCHDCYEEHFFTCERCDNVRPVSEYNDGFCFNCSGTEFVHDYDFRPDEFIQHGTGFQMGMELEVDGGNNIPEIAEELIEYSKEETLFYLKEDGSLNNGFEIVTHPCSLNFFEEDFPFKEVLKRCKNYGFKSHDAGTCGLHIHINKSFLTYTQAVRLGVFIHTQPEVMSKFSRRVSTYCKYKELQIGEGIKDYARRNEDRCEALNWQNRKTIEFRMFRGTLKEDTILATLQFVHALCHFLKTVTTPRVVNGEAWRLFCSYVIKNEKTYKTLIEYLKERDLLCV